MLFEKEGHLIMEALMEHKEPFWMGTLFGSLMMLLTVLAYDRLMSRPDPSAVEMPRNVVEAYRMGLKDSLKTNPPSLDLEATCMELWANKQ
jgi:hypothetical protein